MVEISGVVVFLLLELCWVFSPLRCILAMNLGNGFFWITVHCALNGRLMFEIIGFVDFFCLNYGGFFSLCFEFGHEHGGYSTT